MRDGQSKNRIGAAIIGIGGVALVTAVVWLFGRSAPHAIPALLLLVPIAATSVRADWRVAVPVAIVAAFAFAVAFIPPIGAVRIGLTEDVFVTITFIVVALTVGALKGPRQTSEHGHVLDDRRALLLRGVSHDLRSPLTTIRAISSDLLDGAHHYDDGARSQLLERVVDESERLDRIVGNLLSVSRLQAGALLPNLEPESVAHLLQQSIDRLNRHGNHVIVAEVDPDIDDVAADSIQIDQVLTNLLENSLRHAPIGSTIRVTARQRGGAVEVAVNDDGPGFSPHARVHLFEPFQHNDHRSTGLGLAVCKAIVDAHNGTISIRDEPSGGAHIWFTLPVFSEPRADSARRG